MALTVTHQFVSAKSEQTDPTIVGPNEWNATHTTTNSVPNIVYSIDYNFTAQAPGGSLTSGITNTVTLLAGILGLNGNDSGHYLYVSGGVGTAEAVLVTGGTYTSTSGGTITFTPANNHSGAWTIQSATSGIAEAQQFIGVGNAGEIHLGTTYVYMYGPVIGLSSGKITFRGISIESTNILRKFLSGALFKNTSSGTQWTFINLGINQETGSTSEAINITAATSFHMYNVSIFNGQGIILVGTTYADLDGITYTNGDLTVPVTAGLSLSGQCINTVIRNSMFGGSYNGTNGTLYGIAINGVDGFWATNVGAGMANQGWYITSPASGGYTANIQCVGCFADGCYNYSLVISPGVTPMASIKFIGGHFNGQSPIGGRYPTILIQAGLSALNDLELSGLMIAGSGVGGLEIDNLGAKGLLICNNIIYSNNRLGGSSAQVDVANGVTGLTFNDNIVHSDAYGTGTWGFYQAGTLNGIVKDNDFSNNTVTYYQGGTITGILGPNKGVDDVVATVASAATLALPVGKLFNLTGGTGVTTITTNNPNGFIWNFTVGASTTFTAGTGIGNTITITKFGVIYWNGSKAWIQGI